MPDYPQKITFGELRETGVHHVLVYCRDHQCSHHVEVSADRWPDHVRLSDIEPGFVCTRCGKKGADFRPKFPVVSQFEIQRQGTFQMTMIRSFAIITALCLCGTSASALTMEECSAKYKAAQTKSKSGVGMSWPVFQETECGISAKAPAPTPSPSPAAPVKH